MRISSASPSGWGAALPPRRRGLVLTREGIELAAFARDAVERAAALEARLRGERENTRVVLATGAGALVHVLSPGIRAFTRRADGARDPLSGRVDGRGGDPPRYCPRRRRRDGQRSRRVRGASSDGGRAGPRGAQGAPPREATPRPSVGARWRELRLAAGGGRPQRTALDVAFAAHGVRVDRTATAQGWEVVVRLVELGVGLGVVNDAVRLPRTLVSRPLARRPLRAGNTRGTEIA